MHKHSLSICLLVALCGCNSNPPAKQTEPISHQPQDREAFMTTLQRSFQQVQQAKEQAPADSVHKLMRETHRELFAQWPVLYDWWLQDGDQFNWFDRNFNEQLNIRLQKVGQSAVASAESAEKQSLERYLTACEQRREKRLTTLSSSGEEIVFTKFRTLNPSFFAYTEGLSDARAECNYYAGGELSRFRMNGLWAEEEVLFRDSTGVFRDPDIHFDGNHLLFSWKKSSKEDDFHLYEINLRNLETKQLTFGLGSADIEGIYLPDGNILFNSTRAGTSVDCWFTEVSNLFLCDREGKFMRQVGFDQVHTSNPALLDDGRVVYTRWDYNDRGQVWTQPLFQMNPDGTGQSEYYGLNSWFPTTVTHVRQIPGSRKIMATLMGHHNPQHGKIGIIDPEMGRDENEGVMLVAPVRKPENDRIDSWGQYGDQFQHPFPLSEKEFLVSYTPLGYHIGGVMRFGIYWMNPDGERELLIADADISCNQPVYCAPRKGVFNRTNTVDYAKQNGTYYMQNIYEGNAMEGVTPGTVKKLRIVELEFRPASIGYTPGGGKGGGSMQATPVGVGNAAWDIKKVLGNVDVYEDGSAFFEVPARTALYFQALDESGEVVQTMRSWSTLQPGEMQSCVGCHEHKNTVPVASHSVSMAMAQGIQPIAPDPLIGPEGFSFISKVQPLLDKHCVSCHNGITHKMSLKGELKEWDHPSRRLYPDSYMSLTNARRLDPNSPWQGNPNEEVNWISALSEPTLLKPYSGGSTQSRLIKRLKAGHGKTNLSSDEIYTVAAWIDLVVPMIGDYREANNWTPEEHKYYDYYEQKREKARKEDAENIRLYLESL